MRRSEPDLNFSVEFVDTPYYEPVRPLIRHFEGRRDWPTPADYNDLSRVHGLDDVHGLCFSNVNDDGMTFEARIAEYGEIQCRKESWHDFFNAMTALAFPRTKLAINRLQMRDSSSLSSGRDAEQNMLAHFEECGVIVLSANSDLTNHLRGFRWKELFWHCRKAVERDMRFLLYGHGLYAKALRPYIGLTGHAVIVECESSELNASIEWADRRVSGLLEARSAYTKPRDLSPLPLLGIPGWHSANREECFYNNTSYFRPGRRAMPSV